MWSGPVQAPAKAATEAGSARSSGPTSTESLPVASLISVAVRSPASALRTASVTAAPALASARAVSTPIPDEAPVTIAVPAGEIDALDHLGRRRVKSEMGCECAWLMSCHQCRARAPPTRDPSILVVTGPGSDARVARIVVGNVDRENLIGEYLRARRELIQPAEVGLPQLTGRRRVPGLRREEVAMLAGVSADYYVRLEQGRDQHPSAQVLDALARALQLDDDAIAHLHSLAAPAARRRRRPSPRPERVPAGDPPADRELA